MISHKFLSTISTCFNLYKKWDLGSNQATKKTCDNAFTTISFGPVYIQLKS